MRNFAIIVAMAAAVLVGGALFSNSARADFNGGGPIVKGGMCWVPTSSLDQGYWKECPKPMKMHHKKMKMEMKK